MLESTTKIEPITTDDVEEDTSPAETVHSFNDVKIAESSDLVTTQNGEIYIINAASKINSTPTSSIDYQQDKNITSYNSEQFWADHQVMLK